MVAMPYLMKRPSQKKRYQTMQDRELIASNTQARIMKTRLHFAAYLLPLPIILLTTTIPKLGSPLLGFAIFMMFGLLVMSRFFRAIEDVTTIEIDFRKFKKDTEPTAAASAGPGQ